MAFKEWAAQEGLIRNAPLDEFRGTRIGIDAEDYLTSLLVAPNTREPLLPALGGLPFSLQKNVDADLKSFQEAGITPIFIFNGVNIASQDRAAAGKQARKASGTLNDAWSIYDSGHGDGAVAAFGKACKCGYRELLLIKTSLTLCRHVSYPSHHPMVAGTSISSRDHITDCTIQCCNATCLYGICGLRRWSCRFGFLSHVWS